MSLLDDDCQAEVNEHNKEIADAACEDQRRYNASTDEITPAS